jgi:hypothetical protein
VRASVREREREREQSVETVRGCRRIYNVAAQDESAVFSLAELGEAEASLR